MTVFEPFDPFERRITEAIDEIAAARPPAYLDHVLRLTARTSQRRRPALWRLPPMTRATSFAAAAVIFAVVAGGILLLRPASNVGGPPTPAPTQLATTTPTPAVAPESLRSTWVANAGPASSPGSPATMLRLVVSASGSRVSVFDGSVETLVSTPIAGQAGDLELVSTTVAGGCQVGDRGRYGFAFGTDGAVPASEGTLLALNVVSDTCSARSTMLNRGWVHAIDATSFGGRGISTVFAPMFLITLPAATYATQAGTDDLTITSSAPGRTLIAVKNPVGWTDPCSGTGGAKRPIDPTIAAFTTYMRSLPGFTVQSSDLVIDGHPAVLLTVPSTPTGDCPGNQVYEWTAGAGDGSGGWHLNQGDTDVIYLVEVDGNLVLLQWLGEGVTTAEEQSLFRTVHFTDALPG